MGRGSSGTIIINNFFSLATIIIVSSILLIYTNFIAGKKDKAKIEKLQCEKQTYTYSKVFNQKLLNKSIKALKKGYYRIEGGYLKPKYMKSSIQNIVSLKQVDNFYINAIGTKPKNGIEKFLKIRYELIQNDKKTLKSKLNTGSIITSFRINSIDIFKFYSDFNFLYKNTIKEKINCAIKVYKNHVQNSK